MRSHETYITPTPDDLRRETERLASRRDAIDLTGRVEAKSINSRSLWQVVNPPVDFSSKRGRTDYAI